MTIINDGGRKRDSGFDYNGALTTRGMGPLYGPLDIEMDRVRLVQD